MHLGKVVGTVWATRKDEALVGSKFLIIKNLDIDLQMQNDFIVAVDSVGAGVGETVLYSTGSSARQTAFTQNKPIDAVIMAIVDKVDVDTKNNN